MLHEKLLCNIDFLIYFGLENVLKMNKWFFCIGKSIKIWYNEPCRALCVHKELYKANAFTETLVDVV